MFASGVSAEAHFKPIRGSDSYEAGLIPSMPRLSLDRVFAKMCEGSSAAWQTEPCLGSGACRDEAGCLWWGALHTYHIRMHVCWLRGPWMRPEWPLLTHDALGM